MDKRHGFTLIELLVVIAVIAILAAILFPIFVEAKETARQTKCLANLSQLGRGMRMYADDFDGRFPTVRVASGETPGGTYLNWAGAYETGGRVVPQYGQLFRYVKTSAVYICPTDRNRRATSCDKLSIAEQKAYPLSYSMNVTLSWRNSETLQKPNQPGSGVNHELSKILLLVHEDRTTINDGDFNLRDTYDVPDRVHYDGTTILFCDLHARWQSAKLIKDAIARRVYDPDSIPIKN
jgi:prepilin-type N-terminal cleavage/methylation domain-containing protein